MQTKLIPAIQASIAGAEADSILRSCVHCGMCNATCPTYQLLGDELDGPRGRIYLIKQMLEGQEISSKTQTHLDRCLSCRSCETTCPSGVQYHRLLEIGRAEIEQRAPRTWLQRGLRYGLKQGLSNPRLFQLALQLGRSLRGVLPSHLRKQIPSQAQAALSLMPSTQHERKVLMLAGCVQQSLAPEINAAAARVLDSCGVQSIVAEQAQCCGALALHLSDAERAQQQARANIDAWWPLLQQGAEAIVMTASGCGLMVHEYASLFALDIAYADKAREISKRCIDLGKFMYGLRHQLIEKIGAKFSDSVTWHAPCSLKHGLKSDHFVEELLRELGVDVRVCRDAHLCCGSAGTYSITQSRISLQLRDQKLDALHECDSDRIVSANMACQLHLQAGTLKPVEHWIMSLDRALRVE